MDEHLVRSHLGGFYISSGEPEFIEAYCETCGDYDQIEVSWNSDEENAKIDALAEFFSRDSIKSKEELDNRINELENEDIDKLEIVNYILDYMFFNHDANSETINFLYEYRDLSSEEHDELLKRNRTDLKKQLNIFKNNINNYLINNNEVKKANKTLSLYLKQNNIE